MPAAGRDFPTAHRLPGTSDKVSTAVLDPVADMPMTTPCLEYTDIFRNNAK